MWLFTPFGFFSIVQKQEGDTLTIRARVREDLDRLREQYLPSLSSTVAGGGTDYPFRATAARKAVATAVARITEDITYSNFKNEVARELGHERAHVYGSVWGVMRDLEDLKEQSTGPRQRSAPSSGGAPPAKATATSTRKLRYGGVVLNEAGEVLLYEPLNHFGGYVWTFPKGTQDEGESPEQTALREVEEETGVRAHIVGKVPGEFPGTISTTMYFLMHAEGQPGKPGDEAQAVRWASVDEAFSLIRETTTPEGRKRDLAVLEAARKVL